MHHRMLITILFLVTCITTVCAKTEIEETIEKTLNFKSGQLLKVSGINGGITIITGSDNHIKMVATKRAKANTKQEAEEVLKATWIEIMPIDEGLKIATKHPDKRKLRKGKNIRINYTLTVPRVLNISAITTNGEIRISSTQGETIAKTTNGKIWIDGTEGHLSTKTTNGEIEIKNVKGTVGARTTNGHIELGHILGGIKAKTTNGSVEASLIAPSNDPIQIRTTNGSIDITLYPDFKAQLDAQSTNGKISSDFPITLQGNFSRKSIHGALNGGGNTQIDLRTTNGNIKIGYK